MKYTVTYSEKEADKHLFGFSQFGKGTAQSGCVGGGLTHRLAGLVYLALKFLISLGVSCLRGVVKFALQFLEVLFELIHAHTLKVKLLGEFGYLLFVLRDLLTVII